VPKLNFSYNRVPVVICPNFPSLVPIVGKFRSFLSGTGKNYDIVGMLAPAAITAYMPRFFPIIDISSKDFSLISEINFIGEEL